jgi:hypothetical protein
MTTYVYYISPIEDRRYRSLIKVELNVDLQRKNISIKYSESRSIDKASWPVYFDNTLDTKLYLFAEESGLVMPTWNVNKTVNNALLYQYIFTWRSSYKFQKLTNNPFIFPSNIQKIINNWISDIDIPRLPTDISNIVKEYLYLEGPLDKHRKEFNLI